jgi:glucose-1-phosphate adenylyltransferase
MISAGCDIRGEVVNSVLSPGVKVGPGAVVRDSILFHDCIVEENAVVDLAILDKRVYVGAGAVVGYGEDKKTPNREFPEHLYTGITLVGKEVVVPSAVKIGRNCILQPWTKGEDFQSAEVKSGETV